MPPKPAFRLQRSTDHTTRRPVQHSPDTRPRFSFPHIRRQCPHHEIARTLRDVFAGCAEIPLPMKQTRQRRNNVRVRRIDIVLVCESWHRTVRHDFKPSTVIRGLCCFQGCNRYSLAYALAGWSGNIGHPRLCRLARTEPLLAGKSYVCFNESIIQPRHQTRQHRVFGHVVSDHRRVKTSRSPCLLPLDNRRVLIISTHRLRPLARINSFQERRLKESARIVHIHPRRRTDLAEFESFRS